MTTNSSNTRAGAVPALLCAMAMLCAGPASVRADQVEMRNGDRYVGRVVSLQGQTLVMTNEVLGTVRLARGQVLSVRFGDKEASKPNETGAQTTTAPQVPTASDNTATRLGSPNQSAAAPAVGSNGALELSPALPFGLNSNLIAQVQKQFLSNADPAAKAKFNELLGGFLSGKMTVEDVRAQAKSAAEQIRALRKDMDGESGMMLDMYLGILDRFLKESDGAAK